MGPWQEDRATEAAPDSGGPGVQPRPRALLISCTLWERIQSGTGHQALLPDRGPAPRDEVQPNASLPIRAFQSWAAQAHPGRSEAS